MLVKLVARKASHGKFIRLFSISTINEQTESSQYKDHPPTTFKQYALMNKLMDGEAIAKCKTENELAIKILNSLNDQTLAIGIYSVAPLYTIGSKSRDLQFDRLYWQLLSGLTVTNQIIEKSNRLSQISLIAYSISKLKNSTYVLDQLIMDVFAKIYSIDNKNTKINFIDINQILSFLAFYEKEKGVKYPDMWVKYEQMIISNHVSKLDPKNFTILATRFSQSNQGSLEFWQAMNLKFIQLESQFQIKDLTLTIQSFSRANLLSTEKFISLCSRLFNMDGIQNNIQPQDLSQLLSTAKHQKIKSNNQESMMEFWDKAFELLEGLMLKDMAKLNKKTFVIILNAIYQEMSRNKYKSQWRLMDKLLLKFFNELKSETKSTFIVIRSYSFEGLAVLNPGVRELILELMRLSMLAGNDKMIAGDISLCFKIIGQEYNEKILNILLNKAKVFANDFSEMDKNEILESIEKIERDQVGLNPRIIEGLDILKLKLQC